MIEYALLFGLGFLSTSLLVMLLAPAIHKRIVRFTENRLRATMPLSPQEIRAQKDMVRAAYAAENARTTQELVREREKSMALQFQNDALSKEASRILADHQDLQVKVEEMQVEMSRLRSEALRHENEAITLAETVRRLEESAAAKDVEIEQVLGRLQRLMREIDNLKIESAAREAEIEGLKQRAQSFRDEREELRREAKLAAQRAKEAEQRLIQEEHTRLRLDDRLARQIAENADKDAALERRMQELANMRERLKAANAAARAATRALRNAKILVPAAAEGDFNDPPEEPRIEISPRNLRPAVPAQAQTSATPLRAMPAAAAPIAAPVVSAAPAPAPRAEAVTTTPSVSEPGPAAPAPAPVVEAKPAPMAATPAPAPAAEPSVDLDRMEEELRLRQDALTDLLLRADIPANDDALREEIADLAARMIVLTSLKEGKTSPLADILPVRATLGETGARATLGERARALRAGIEGLPR
jgi:Chromosome segregation ATPases